MMEKNDMANSANNSSDFVRKLYKMLEDPSYESVVRWGNDGDSFVVLENEKFTKSILPKHFKHSNFASFVRQLNKYDFHKVRQNNEENGQSPYGQGAWEFKHPEFQANKKDSLDNIRRKAPAARKPNATVEESPFPAQQIDLVNTQLIATQQQLQHLQERYNELESGHVILLQQVVQLQKIVKNHDGAMHRVMGFLHMMDAQRRNSRTGTFANGQIGIADLVGNGPDDHPASPLQQASLLLGEFSTDALFNKDLEQLQAGFTYRSEFSTPSNDQVSAGAAPTSTGGPRSNHHMGYSHMHYDVDNMVYPVGQTNGINPINSEHIHNIPYSLPPSTTVPPDAQMDMSQGTLSRSDQKKSAIETVWGPHKPRILLVEDDKTCARIGSKFLQTFECAVETAADGLEAVSKINQAQNSFDLILMDIIMPHLDGVSATVCIREVAPAIPIIAMTSNIRADDIDMYFRYGMNDVLPKPFTKEGMLRTLEKHLQQFKKNFIHPSQAQPPHSAVTVYSTSSSNNTPITMTMSHMSATQSIKDEASPSTSKSPASSWHSPNQITGQSPTSINPNVQANFGVMQASSAYAMAPIGYPTTAAQVAQAQAQAHAQAQAQAHAQAQAMPGPGPPRQAAPGHRRVISDIQQDGIEGDRPDKRLRMFAPGPPGAYPQ